MMKEVTIYNRENEYNEKIAPKLEEIKNLCIKHDIPYVMAFATGNDDEKTSYEMDGLMPGVKGMKLTENKLNEVFRIISGYSQPGNVDMDKEDLDDDFPEEL